MFGNYQRKTLNISDAVILPAKSRTIPFAAIPRSNHYKSMEVLDWVRGERWNSEPMLSKEGDHDAEDEEKLTDDSVSGSKKTGSSCENILSVCEPTEAALAYGIDPRLYMASGRRMSAEEELCFGEENIGRLWLALEYNPESERLHLTLMRIKNLPSRTRASSNACDPVVRVCLLPDERRWLQSKVKSRSCNPRFDECFTFYVSQKDFNQRTLKVTVYDVNRNKTLKKIGHVTYPLKTEQIEPNERVIIWRDLEKEVKQEAAGSSQLYLSLCFNNSDRLSVGVYSARNLKSDTDNHQTSGPEYYVKVVFMKDNKKIKSKKTGTIRHTINPIFNEMFHFTFTPEDTSTSCIAVTVVQPLKLYRHIVVGRLTVGSFMFARGTELEHWNQMIIHPKQQISQWHDLVVE